MAAAVFSRRSRKEASTPVQWDKPVLKCRFEGHEDTIPSFVFLHDNVHIVSGSWDGTMRKWNCDTGLLVGEPWEGQGKSIYALALSPDGKVIACGRVDGSVQQWNTDGEMIAGVWAGDGKAVRSLSWSPSGDYIASGSDDGNILIRKAASGKVKGGPIKTEQSYVWSLAYSPSGNRIASGGSNKTICIWSTKTGELVVGPIQGLGMAVTSLVWSSDSTKLYSASDEFARVFCSKSGALLHQLKHDNYLYSGALSPKDNVLACVGNDGVAQLWDAGSQQPLSLPFHQDDCKWLNCVSFSPDGRYIAYSGDDKKLTLWIVRHCDIAPQLTAVPILGQDHGEREVTQHENRPEPQQETQPRSSSSSFLDADATGGDGIIKEGHDDPYDNFFKSSQSSFPASIFGPPQPPNPSPARHFWNAISRYRLPPIPLRNVFVRRACSNSPTLDQRVRAGEDEEGEMDDDVSAVSITTLSSQHDSRQRCSANDPPVASNDEPSDTQSPMLDDSPPPAKHDDEDDRNIWNRLIQARWKAPTDPNMTLAVRRPKVVEVYAVRGFQGYVARTPSRKTTLHAVTCSAPLAAAHVSSSSRPLSSHAMVSNGVRHVQPTGDQSLHVSPSHFVTDYHATRDSDSRSSIEGSCNRFLDKICFPCGHYHENS
ncbi:WD40-repeat-containing domain protein [Suillus clintonianus]|uniref:WD40-repeat-containing domain protein n=1 Tax=Suillus clintonianus TaxID=1904413 RepID=UPI001B8786E5|nr:WD40-repeat-containing domain protein [Suillus clintonianus]KAG2121086.1 WD40-repeat-containing domain protein [Suillus clintonianus]